MQKFYSQPFTLQAKEPIIKDGWNEDDHPRDDNGRFTSGGGGGESSDSADTTGEGSSSNGAAEARGDFGGASTEDFVDSLANAQSTVHAKDAWRVSTPDAEEFQEEHPGACCHITPGGSTIAVSQDGDIVGVCKSNEDSDYKGKDLLKMAVEAGGTKLDSYEGNHGFYIKCGFEPVSWCKWDGNYAPPGWDSSRDNEEDIIFYKYTGAQTEYRTADAFKEAVEASEDYDTAKNARDNSID
jgi:hypothetical protein